MSDEVKKAAAWALLAGAAFAVSGCQQGADTATNASANTTATNSASIAPAPAAPTPAPAPATPDPAEATGPLAQASDADLPEPCQAYIRGLQACLDRLTEPDEAFRAGWVRTSADSRRRTWALAQDDIYRARICAADLESLPADTRTRFQCAR